MYSPLYSNPEPATSFSVESPVSPLFQWQLVAAKTASSSINTSSCRVDTEAYSPDIRDGLRLNVVEAYSPNTMRDVIDLADVL